MKRQFRIIKITLEAKSSRVILMCGCYFLVSAVAGMVRGEVILGISEIFLSIMLMLHYLSARDKEKKLEKLGELHELEELSVFINLGKEN